MIRQIEMGAVPAARRAWGNLEGYAAHFVEQGAQSTHCSDLAGWGVDLTTFSAEDWAADLRDPRVGQVVALDPGLTYGLSEADVAGTEASTLLITLGAAQTRLLATDISEAGSGLARLMPQADWRVIAPGSHFSALLTCKPIGPAILEEEGDDPVCDVAPGESRSATHSAVIEAIADHLGL